MLVATSRWLVAPLLLPLLAAWQAPPQPAAPGEGSEALSAFLTRELERRLGPAAEYRVRVDEASGGDGVLGRVEVTGTDVRTRAGLVISRLEIAVEPARLGENLRPETDDIRGTFSAYVDRPALQRYIRRNAGERLRDVRVDLRRGRIVLEGRPEVLGLRIGSEVAGTPVVRRGSQIHFRAERVKVLGVRITDLAAGALERKVNPVLDLDRMELPVRLRRCRIRRGHLELHGEADLTRTRRRERREPDREPPRRRRGRTIA